MVRLLHLHRDPDWQTVGVHAYYECRCGARRVRRITANRAGPVRAGWPQLRDRHNQPVLDTGWVKL